MYKVSQRIRRPEKANKKKNFSRLGKICPRGDFPFPKTGEMGIEPKEKPISAPENSKWQAWDPRRGGKVAQKSRDEVFLYLCA